MGIIDSGIQSIAYERAKAACRIEKILSEVTESVADDMVELAAYEVTFESANNLSNEEMLSLLSDLPADASDEKQEIARAIACEDDSLDIDDIVGVNMNAE